MKSLLLITLSIISFNGISQNNLYFQSQDSLYSYLEGSLNYQISISGWTGNYYTDTAYQNDHIIYCRDSTNHLNNTIDYYHIDGNNLRYSSEIQLNSVGVYWKSNYGFGVIYNYYSDSMYHCINTITPKDDGSVHYWALASCSDYPSNIFHIDTSYTPNCDSLKSLILGNKKSIKQEFNLYPNPFANQFAIKIPNGVENDIKIIVKDILGKEQITSIRKHSSRNDVMIDTSELTKGIYFVELISEDKNIHFEPQKIVKY